MDLSSKVYYLVPFLALTACSSTPQISPKQIGEHIKSGKTTVLPIEKPIQLSEKTKSQLVSNAIISSVLGTALGGGHGEAAKILAETTGQALPESYKIASGSGADLALAKKLSEYFSYLPGNNSAPAKNYVLTVKAKKWELGYVSLLSSQEYDLTHHFQILLDEKEGNNLKNVADIYCGNVSGNNKNTRMSHEAWAAENYKALNMEAEKVVGECYQRTLTALGLSG